MNALPLGRILAFTLIAAAVAAVIGGMFLLGSPAKQRQLRLDEVRVGDLRSISRAVQQYYRDQDRLPSNLEQIEIEPTLPVVMTDPVSNEPYLYRVISEDRFELCAVFARASERDRWVYRDHYDWKHGAGMRCFEQRVQED